MEQQPVRDCGGLFKVACSIFHFDIGRQPILDWNICQEMAEKSGQIAHILERENREFEQAMWGQVGTTFSSTNGSN